MLWGNDQWNEAMAGLGPGGYPHLNNTASHRHIPSSEEHNWLGELDRSLTEPAEDTYVSKVTIHTVPRHLRTISLGDFEPIEFRFGLHNRSLRNHGIDKMKIDVAREFMNMKKMLNVEQWKDFTRQIVKDGNLARQVYEEPDVPLSYSDVRFLGLGSDDVVRNVLTLDALFLVVFLQAGLNKYGCEGFKNAIMRRGLLYHTGNFYKDAVLLENQVPMCLLREVMRALYPDPPAPCSNRETGASPTDVSPREVESEYGSSRTKNSSENGSFPSIASNSFSRSSHLTSSLHSQTGGMTCPRPQSAGDDLEEILQLAVSLVYPFIPPSPHDKAAGSYAEEEPPEEQFQPAPYLVAYCVEGKNKLQGCEHLLDCVYRVVSHTPVPAAPPSLRKDGGGLAVGETRREPVTRVFSKSANPIRLQRAQHIRGITRFKANLVPTLSDIDREPVLRVFSKLSNLPRAIMLRRSGIRIKPTKNPVLTEVRFDKVTATLFLPRVEFFDYTNALFRNLVIYEQLARPESTEVMSYLLFLDYLIDTAEDVAYLSKCDVLKNNVGSDEDVAIMVNKIRIGLASSELSGKWSSIHKEIIAHCDVKWHAYKAEFRGTYFSRPWYIISFIIACVLLIATIIQTVLAFMAL